MGPDCSNSGPAHASEVEINTAKMVTNFFILFPCEKINGRRFDGAGVNSAYIKDYLKYGRNAICL